MHSELMDKATSPATCRGEVGTADNRGVRRGGARITFLFVAAVAVALGLGLTVSMLGEGTSNTATHYGDAFSRGNPYNDGGIATTTVTVTDGDLGYISPVVLENYLRVPVTLLSVVPTGLSGGVRFEGEFLMNACTDRPVLFDQDSQRYGWIRKYRLLPTTPEVVVSGLIPHTLCASSPYWIDKVAFGKAGVARISGFEVTYEVVGLTFRDYLPYARYRVSVLNG